jgi:hypothetical protein
MALIKEQDSHPLSMREQNQRRYSSVVVKLLHHNPCVMAVISRGSKCR